MTRVGNLEAYGVIYKITNKVNGKVYIGQTTRKDGFNGRYHCKGEGIERVYGFIKTRIERNDSSCNYYLYNSIKKYGFENFEVNKTFDVAFSLKELNIKEELWIRHYNCTNRKYGYNFRAGGDNYLYANDSLVRNGVRIVCIDDNLIFKSISEASKYYGLSTHTIRETYKKKHTYTNFKNEIPIFRKIEGTVPPHVRHCAICGKTFERINNSSKKYCKNCSQKTRTRKTTKDTTLIRKDFDKNYSKTQEYLSEHLLRERKENYKKLSEFIRSVKRSVKSVEIQEMVLKKFGYKVSISFIVQKRKTKHTKR